jgi:acyl carrier protein
MNDLATDLRHFITENFLFGVETPFGDDDSLLEHGIVDSTGVLELITHLEDAHGITVGDEDLVPENLDSIANLVRFIAEKREVAVAS